LLAGDTLRHEFVVIAYEEYNIGDLSNVNGKSGII
jgi:hypothetical protein